MEPLFFIFYWKCIYLGDSLPRACLSNELLTRQLTFVSFSFLFWLHLQRLLDPWEVESEITLQKHVNTLQLSVAYKCSTSSQSKCYIPPFFVFGPCQKLNSGVSAG